MDYIRVYARPEKRIKARSKRGWTEPTPASIAKQQAAKAEADRKAAKEAQRRENETRHREWLYEQAKQLPPEEQFDWLSQHGSPGEVTATMDRLARTA